jgi:hypothetical protein
MIHRIQIDSDSHGDGLKIDNAKTLERVILVTTVQASGLSVSY